MDKKFVIELLRRTDVKDGSKTVLCGLREQTHALVLSGGGGWERSEA